MKYSNRRLNSAIWGFEIDRLSRAERENVCVLESTQTVHLTSNPRSSAVRSSDMAHKTFHRQSISARYPRQIGDAALNAS